MSVSKGKAAKTAEVVQWRLIVTTAPGLVGVTANLEQTTWTSATVPGASHSMVW